MYSFSLTDDVYSLFHLQHRLQSLCQSFSIPMLIIVYIIILLYNGFNINNYYIHFYKQERMNPKEVQQRYEKLCQPLLNKST